MMKPLASLSLDLDNKWSYMKTHGDSGWESFPSYLDAAVPKILDFLKAREQLITFFIVGQDAALDKNKEQLRSIADAGHEIGCHSYNHEPWLHLYSYEKLDEELAMAEESILGATGQKPVGFRGPGFSLSENTLNVLSNRGYMYDATVFPNVLNPLARAYMFKTSKLTKEQKEQRKALFGTLDDALRPVKPYKWQLGSATLTEIPVTTMPIFKIPIHLSYVLYLSNYSKALAIFYFRVALFMCKLTGTAPSILLHPLDFIGAEDAKELAFFPGMRMPVADKLEVVDKVLKMLAKSYQVVTMREHANSILQNQSLPMRQPRFRTAK
jgi:peptidoglycan/xylan/chitin deacetylase (PgdA/CDA1 family)